MKVFLAHSSHDNNFVQSIKRDLRCFGFDTWVDLEDEILAGDSIIRTIELGIDNSDYFCVILSSNSARSEWVSRELNTALAVETAKKRETFVIPILLEQCDIPGFLGDKKHANFTSSYEDGFDELLKALRFHPGAKYPDQDLVEQRLALAKEGRSLLRQGITDMAEIYIQRALSMAREDAVLWHLLGQCLLQQQLPANAMNAYELANELSPHSRWVLYDYGSCVLYYAMFGQNDPKGMFPDPKIPVEVTLGIAEKCFNEILEIDDQDSVAHYQLASLHAFRGELDRARTHLEKALQIDPLYRLAAEALDRLNDESSRRHDTGQR